MFEMNKPTSIRVIYCFAIVLLYEEPGRVQGYVVIVVACITRVLICNYTMYRSLNASI